VLGLPATKPLEITPTKLEPLPDASDPAVRVAAAIIGWNVLRHFYPYHDIIGGERGEDWEQVLGLVLTDVLDDSGPEDLMVTLRRLDAVAQVFELEPRTSSPAETCLGPAGDEAHGSIVRRGSPIRSR
jgi:hypothetical protein